MSLKGGGRSWECVLFEEGDMGTEHTNIEYIYGGTLKRNHILKLKLSMATKNINMRKAVVRFTF